MISLYSEVFPYIGKKNGQSQHWELKMNPLQANPATSKPLKSLPSKPVDKSKKPSETEGKINAKKKLIQKNCNMIIYNKINKNNKVFELNENKISIITKNKTKNYTKTSKINCAKYIIDSIYNEINN